MTLSSESTAEATAAPLAGFTAGRRGDSVAARVAETHLRLLGAEPAAGTGGDARQAGAPPAAPAGRLLVGTPHGPLTCDIDWSGPVDASLDGEAGVQAACGIMHVHGRTAGRPRPLGIDYAGAVSGVLAVQGVLAAAIGRMRGGPALGVRTSLAQAALLSVGQYLAAATAPGEHTQDAPPRSAPPAAPPPFASADGVRFEIETFDPEPWQRFWSLLGADRAALAAGWRPFLHRYATATCALPPELHSAAAAHVFHEIAGAAQSAGISLVRVRGGADMPVPGGTGGAAAAPWSLTPAAAERPRHLPPPCPPHAALPLEGLVVVESTRRVQGPLAGHVLRLLGAEVVRVEPPGGDPLRWMPPTVGTCSARFLALNRGKRTVEIDIKSAAGQREIRELVAGADVFLHNWAPGKAASFGLDAADLQALRPGLVYAHAAGWGRAEGAGAAMGGAEPVGTDFLVQAHSGLGALVRPRGEPPAPSLMTLTDVLGGLVSAEGVLAALLARCRGDGGSRVDSSLYSAAEVLTASAAPQADRRRGARRPLWGPLHAPLPTRDGVHLALGSRARSAPERLARVLGADRDGTRNPAPAAEPGADPAADACAAVAAHCRDRGAAELAGRLRGAGLDAVPVCTDLAALAADPRFAGALEAEGAAFVRSPWEFTP